MLKAEDRGKLLELKAPIPFQVGAWQVTIERYKTLRPLVEQVTEVLRQFEDRGAFEVPIFGQSF